MSKHAKRLGAIYTGGYTWVTRVGIDYLSVDTDIQNGGWRLKIWNKARVVASVGSLSYSKAMEMFCASIQKRIPIETLEELLRANGAVQFGADTWEWRGTRGKLIRLCMVCSVRIFATYSDNYGEEDGDHTLIFDLPTYRLGLLYMLEKLNAQFPYNENEIPRRDFLRDKARSPRSEQKRRNLLRKRRDNVVPVDSLEMRNQERQRSFKAGLTNAHFRWLRRSYPLAGYILVADYNVANTWYKRPNTPLQVRNLPG